MTDREKVIKGLELCKYDPDPGQENKGIHSCVKCPYYNDGIMPDCQVMFTDAISMLKEQEAVKPVLFGRMWECGNCSADNLHTPVGIYLDDRRDDFCRKCGKKVQWDD